MGADKHSSPKRELSLCPKFTTKNLHTSLSKTRSHNGHTNPGNKPQMIPKRKRNSRRKGLSNSAQHQADRLQAPSGPSAWPRRTVRGAAADRPKIAPSLHYCTLNNGPSVLYPQTIHTARTVRPILADYPPNLVQLKPHGQTDRNKSKQDHMKNSTNCWLKASSRTIYQGCMDYPPGAQTAARARPHEGQHHRPTTRSPKTTMGLLSNHK
jgi:hypothetical protein